METKLIPNKGKSWQAKWPMWKVMVPPKALSNVQNTNKEESEPKVSKS